jgi:L-iditol 2-dehydrogenase
MREARLYGVRDLRLGEAHPPAPGPDESLIRVTAVGICGSDLHWFAEGGIGGVTVTRPLVPGHEFGGTVQSGPLAGRRVAVDPAISCGTCARCREGNPNLCPTVRFAGHGTCDGALREYLAWPTRLLHPIPDDLTDAGAALLEPLGIAIHAFDLGHVRLGSSVAVVGCGPIGLMLMQVARAGGAGPVVAVEPLPHRRTAAAGYGLGPAVDPAADLDAALGDAGTPVGVDVAFEVAGTDAAVAAATRLVRPGGRVVLAGIPAGDTTQLPASTARRKGLTIALVRRMRDTYPRAIQLVTERRVTLEPLVTDRFALPDAPAAFASAAARTGIKTIITDGRVSG